MSTTTTSGNTSAGDGKGGGARDWVKSKLKALSQLLNNNNELIREQEELEDRICRTEWSSINEDERTKLEQQIAFNWKKQELYIMRSSKTILSILHRGFDKIKQGGRIMVLDEKSAEKLYNRLRLGKSDGDSFKIAFENEKGTLKDILSPGNRWLMPNAYLRIFGKKFMKDMGFVWINLKVVRKVRFPGRE